jgi:hypothetical protein
MRPTGNCFSSDSAMPITPQIKREPPPIGLAMMTSQARKYIRQETYSCGIVYRASEKKIHKNFAPNYHA